MHMYNDHCCDTADMSGIGVVVVDGDYGQPAAVNCACEEHDEV